MVNIITEPAILNAKLMHKRILPKENKFSYGVYYVAIPLSNIEDGSIFKFLSKNKFSLHGFNPKNHGYRDERSLRIWAGEKLSELNIKEPKNITLICIPSILSYVFNPVSFWVCYDENDEISAIISEVNNTFGQTYSYVCHNDDFTRIKKNDWLWKKKRFRVSPFLKVEGFYDFQFNINNKLCQIQIDYSNAEKNKTLITSLNGKFSKLCKKNLLKSFLKNPLLSFKVIYLIHYQALKLLCKKIKFYKS